MQLRGHYISEFIGEYLMLRLIKILQIDVIPLFVGDHRGRSERPPTWS